MKAWLPRKRDLPGIILALVIGGAGFALRATLLDRGPYLSDVVLAIALGALILNTGAGRLIGLGKPADRDADPYERGLRYTGKFVLRLAVILMGLKIQTELFRFDQAIMAGAVILCALPTAFFLVHFAAGRLGLRRETADLLAIGTMICVDQADAGPVGRRHRAIQE